MSAASLHTLLRSSASPAVVQDLAPDDAAALADLVSAEHARRDAEGLETLDAALGALPWPVRKAVGKAFGR